MNASTKTRSALRAALKQEDASLTERLPAEEQKAAATELPESAPAAVAVELKTQTKAAVVSAKPAKASKPKTNGSKAGQARPTTKLRTTKPPSKGQGAAAEVVVAAVPTKDPSAPAKGKAASGGSTSAATSDAPVKKKGRAKAGEVDTTDGKKEKREKVVRDSFSIPANEHRRIKALREQLGKAGRLSSKSEVLRAGLQLLGERNAAELVALLDALPPVTDGKRGKKH